MNLSATHSLFKHIKTTQIEKVTYFLMHNFIVILLEIENGHKFNPFFFVQLVMDTIVKEKTYHQ
jgi:hypothetical protein